jgi:diheme cytochrome c
MKYSLAISAVIFSIGFVTLPIVWGSDISWKELEQYKHKSTGVVVVSSPVYEEECGSCHMAYPPGLLPANSWRKMMSGLEDHFGDNAELDADKQQSISEILLANSADQSDYRRSRKFNRSVQAEDPPARISETPYFKQEHDEIPDRMVTGNAEVKSFANCNACHTKAEQGSFKERDIHVPGYGQWDD